MKLNFIDLQEFYKTVNNATDIIKNDNDNIISFSYIKYYGTSKHNAKLIKVSLKSDKEEKKMAAEPLNEKDFFNLLADNVAAVKDVKLHCDKIYKYTLNGQKYKTDKSSGKKLFDFLEYKDFLKVTRSRFWGNDALLRNGYFSGLIGTNDTNIFRYKENSKDYELYDIDFNSAYPYCFTMPLPYDKFYSVEEWEAVKDKFITHTKFYQIKIKCIVNEFKIFVPPCPFIEYKDFDFLLSRSGPHMIVSQERLNLINKVYGDNSYIILKEYICPTKIYLKLMLFTQDLYKKIQAAKEANDTEATTYLKIALNSLIGMFGKRDEARSIDKLKLINSDVLKDVISIEWTEAERKEQRNYLPLSMLVNDITASRLFTLMTDTNALRLCYNTDGGIIAVKNGTKIDTSKDMGKLKADRIYKPFFYYSTMLYNRPLIYDAQQDKCFNTKSIKYNCLDDNFYYTEQQNVNTRDGFIQYKNTYKIVIKEYTHFNFRQNEILIKLVNNDLFKRLRDTRLSALQKDVLKSVAVCYEELCNPYDDLYNGNIRHAPQISEQLILENFIKTT